MIMKKNALKIDICDENLKKKKDLIFLIDYKEIYFISHLNVSGWRHEVM